LKLFEKRIKNVLTKRSFGDILTERREKAQRRREERQKVFPEIGKLFVDKSPSACYYIQAAP
jgi:hypothetical protein